MRKTLYMMLMTVVVLALSFTSCSKWTEPETVRLNVIYPWDRDPATWEDYFQRLRQFKERKHFLSLAEFDNAPEKPAGEKDYLRALPDSLDFVSLTNADAFNGNDREDLPLLHQKGTKVLYTIDMAKVSSLYPDQSQFTQYLDQVVASVEQEGMDGWTVKANLPAGDEGMKTRFIQTVERLSAVSGKTLVYVGSYIHLDAPDVIRAFDLVVLNTQEKEYEADIEFAVLMAKKRGIPQEKIILAGTMGTSVVDADLQEKDALEVVSNLVFTQGPVGGLAIFDIQKDYFHTENNYMRTEELIQKLNPSK